MGAEAHPPVPPTDKDMPREEPGGEKMDLKKLKNDKERIAFLEDYRNTEIGWYEWKHDSDLDRSWWRYDLEDCALIVEEQLHTFQWPNEHVAPVIHWYIVKDWHKPFGDSGASRTMALKELKEAVKK